MTTNDVRKQVIQTESAPQAIGPYSQAVVANGMVYTAGQIPLDPATGQVAGDDIVSQTAQVMQNLSALLEASGSSLAQVVKTTCFLANLDDFPAFNEVYGRSFLTRAPARSTVQVAKLPMGVLIEVECAALVIA